MPTVVCEIDRRRKCLFGGAFYKINLDRLFKTKSISAIRDGSDIFLEKKIISSEISAVKLTQMDFNHR